MTTSIEQPKCEVEFINSKTEFKWRLKLGDEYSEYSSHYAGLLVHRFKDGRTFAVATGYWEGTLPVERPFQIVIL